MVRKLIKDWNKLPAGAGVTTDPAEQVLLVDLDRLKHLDREGFLADVGVQSPQPAGLREIPAEVKTAVGDEEGAADRPVAALPTSARGAAPGKPMLRDRETEERGRKAPNAVDDPEKIFERVFNWA